MKTYTETQGEKPFNWNEAIQRGIDGLIVEYSEEHELLIKLSQSWVTCPCGNQCDVIPRIEGGVPEDDKLSDLGVSFSMEVEDFEWKEAKEILARIEKRSAELINEINSGK